MRPVLAGCVVAVALAAAGHSLAAQSPDRSALRARLTERRTLDPVEIDALLAAVRAVIGGHAFHFVAADGGFGADALVEPDGHVRFIRNPVGNRVTFTEYTGRIARRCDGSVAEGELVVEYREQGAGWAASARASSPADLLRPVFDMLVGLKPLADDGVATAGARRLSVGWNLETPRSSEMRGGGGGGGGQAAFALADPTVTGTERITIDADSLRPLEWEFVPSGMAPRSYRFAFDPELVLMPPPIGGAPPGCVDGQNLFVPVFR